MRRSKKSGMISMLTVFAVILAALPLFEKYVLGHELRQLPGSNYRPAVVDEVSVQNVDALAPAEILGDYGYYPEDRWVEAQCGFRVRTGDSGKIELGIYYPFELTGNEISHIFIDGQWVADFTLDSENTTVALQARPNEEVFIQINSDFSRAPAEGDERTLAFVLTGVWI